MVQEGIRCFQQFLREGPDLRCIINSGMPNFKVCLLLDDDSDKFLILQRGNAKKMYNT